MPIRQLLKMYLVTLLTLLTSCENKWDTVELFAQKIDGTSKILYKYEAWGGRDTCVWGFIIYDSTEVFRVPIDRIPIRRLQTIPSKNGFTAIVMEETDFEKPTVSPVFTPLAIKKINENGVLITLKTYQFEGLSNREQGYESYQFESFRETRDSIFFYNLDDVESMEPTHLDILKLRKPNVFIRQDTLNAVDEITIEDLQIKRITNEIISSKTYSLKPKTKMKSDRFSDYGIFKKVRYVQKN